MYTTEIYKLIVCIICCKYWIGEEASHSLHVYKEWKWNRRWKSGTTFLGVIPWHLHLLIIIIWKYFIAYTLLQKYKREFLSIIVAIIEFWIVHVSIHFIFYRNSVDNNDYNNLNESWINTQIRTLIIRIIIFIDDKFCNNLILN